MRKSLLAAITLVVALVSGTTAYTYYRLAGTGTKMTSAATALVDSLNAEQRQAMLFPYDSDKRVGWHFIPKDERKGLMMRDMTDQQRALTHDLLQVALSQIGYDKTDKIMANEALLKHVQKSGPIRDPLRYYVSIFGEPKEGQRWGLSFEGHHLSLNFVVEGDEVVSSTPQFFATNPAELKEDYHLEGYPQGMAILKKEEDLGLYLINMMAPAQQKVAIISEKSPSEIRNAGETHPPQTAPEGIAWGHLNKNEMATLTTLIDTYISAMPQDVAAKRYAALKEGGWESIHFAWAGGLKKGVPHYYRIQGKTFLIEFVNAQPDVSGNPANHIHCVWRDLQGDFALPAK
ncbi:DUF3500 domain-containing protein [Bremerella cremea]|uniref:DUF3500 domain-containing protein n=1 Tax=Bremerella cremea TaxID=1031537 RepID=A0A368KN74_9BACT|nr:DUF3500 domain-containing protein [Bremerella cremea]RCS44693.1 DUF3500 domain-containing protein [Bremerella cremea]